jgi:L-iditol 2-dehydrogenase
MKGAVLHAINDLRYDEVDLPPVGDNDVLVKVTAAGICGSDVPRVKSKGTYTFPTIPGHEFSGEISHAGAAVTSRQVGEKVAIYPLICCKKCTFCQQRKENLCEDYNYLGSRCNGGFAEYVVCPARNAIPIPDGVSLEAAALTEPLAVGLRGVKRGKVKSGDTVIVFGLGTIGLCTLLCAQMQGARVIGVDRNQHKLDIAKSMGAHAVINSTSPHYQDELHQHGTLDVVVECSGANIFQDAAIAVVKKSGRIVLVGNPSSDVQFSEKRFQQLLRKEISVVGCWNSLITPGEHEWEEVLRALAAGKLQPLPLVTHRYGLHEAKQVFDQLHNKEVVGYCKGMFVL